MAQNPEVNRKAQLQAELERARAELSREMRGVRGDLDVQSRVRETFVHHKAIWMTGAALAGWVLSRLPSRKKKVYLNGQHPTEKNQLRAGLLASLFKLGTSMIKPAVTAYATRKVSEYVSRR